MGPTRHDLPVGLREKLVTRMNARLADLIDMQFQLKQAHWNVKGAKFIALHELFGDLSESLDEPIDDLAERIVQLGGTAEGTLASVAGRTTLPEYPLGLTDGLGHCEQLVASSATLATRIRADVDETAEWGDALTADLLTGLGRQLDKQTWFLDSHLRG